MERGNVGEFGVALVKSHESLRDRLKVSSPALDRVVDLASACLAGGARLTGAGFGGFVVVFCSIRHRKLVRRRMIEKYSLLSKTATRIAARVENGGFASRGDDFWG
jgi:galactokinase